MNLVSLPSPPIPARHLIAGVLESGAAPSDIRSPYDGSVIGSVPAASAAEVSRAVSAAQEAFEKWRRTPLKERTKPLFRFRELVLRDLAKLSNTAAAEAGKTVAEAEAGILKGLEVTEFALSLQNLLGGGKMEVSRGVSCEVIHEPLGVVVGITPFNFPAMVPLWMFPIAVTLGNSFILKPSEKVPLTPTLLGELMVEAGYPAGVFSVVHGGRDTVESLVDHPLTRAVAFVGSTPVAKSLYARATALGKRALCLGGAKNHLIVVPDAEPAMTVQGIVASFTGCAGQRCMAASVMVAVGDVSPIIEGTVKAAKELPLGSGMGALIDKAAHERISKAVETAKHEGATILVDGREAKPPKGFEGGNWLGPTVIDGVKPGMQCASDELFGPVLSIIRADSLDAALELEKKNPYGNATSVFTTSGAVARYVSERASTGMIGINIGVPVPREPFSFGGTKESKFGHGDITGESAVEFWTDRKKVTVKWALQPDTSWMG